MASFRSRSARILSLCNIDVNDSNNNYNNYKCNSEVLKKKNNYNDENSEEDSSICSSPAPSITSTILEIDEIVSKRKFTESEDTGEFQSSCNQSPFKKPRLYDVQSKMESDPVGVMEYTTLKVMEPTPVSVMEPASIKVMESAPVSVMEYTTLKVMEPTPIKIIEPFPIKVMEPPPVKVMLEPAPECKKILKIKNNRALVDYSPSGSSSCASPVKEVKPSPPKKKNVRARLRNPEAWKSNVRKKAKEAGQAYVSVRNKPVPKKEMKGACEIKCKFQCNLNVPKEERYVIFNNYYSLSDEGKNHFILEHTKRNVAKRHENEKIRKNYSYEYNLTVDGKKKRVCSLMFLNTVAISCRKVYNVHDKKKYGEVPEISKQGKHRKKFIDDESKNFIRSHIESFPKVDSHYCRADSKRQYLDSQLSLNKMYELYVELCSSKNLQPCKQHAYAKIFNEEYNLFFHKPKKDVCDKCHQYNLIKEKNVATTDDHLKDLENHIEEKNNMREKRRADREILDDTIVIVSFDLQNVISLPISNVGVNFYKRKLTCYNLTAVAISKDADKKEKKNVYCCIWYEYISGRTGNDLSSAFRKILNQVTKDYPKANQVLSWSDSCTPQNRNQMMAFAMSDFLKNNKMIKNLTMKYSTAGHGAVQEVDAVHSEIEKQVLSGKEIHSPISLIRKLVEWTNGKKNYRVLQMLKDDFLDFEAYSSTIRYNEIPFTKVQEIVFENADLTSVKFKTSHGDQNYKTVALRLRTDLRSRKPSPLVDFGGFIVQPMKLRKGRVPALKVNDIESVYHIMEDHDKKFYQDLFA